MDPLHKPDGFYQRFVDGKTTPKAGRGFEQLTKHIQPQNEPNPSFIGKIKDRLSGTKSLRDEVNNLAAQLDTKATGTSEFRTDKIKFFSTLLSSNAGLSKQQLKDLREAMKLALENPDAVHTTIFPPGQNRIAKPDDFDGWMSLLNKMKS